MDTPVLIRAVIHIPDISPSYILLISGAVVISALLGFLKNSKTKLDGGKEIKQAYGQLQATLKNKEKK